MSVDINVVKQEVKDECEDAGEWEVPLHPERGVEGGLRLGSEQPQDVTFAPSIKAEPLLNEEPSNCAEHPSLLVTVKLEPLSEASVTTEPQTKQLEQSTHNASIQDCDEVDFGTNSEFENTESDIHEAKKHESSINLMSHSSREKYLRVYNNFIAWKTEKNAQSFTENVLLEYFNELSKSLQPPSLWAIYSMLKATIHTNHNVNIKHYAKLTALLKSLAAGYKPKQSGGLTAEHVEKFLKEAPDELYLADKVILILGIIGACKSTELTKIKTSDLKDHNETLLVYLPNTKAKSNRAFEIRDELLNIVRKYQMLRPKNVEHDRFFLHYVNGKCTKYPIGRHRFAAVPRTIAAYLQLPNAGSYTAHCFHRTSVNLLPKAGGNCSKRRGDCRKVAENIKGRETKGEVSNETPGLISCTTEEPLRPVANSRNVSDYSLPVESSRTENHAESLVEKKPSIPEMSDHTYAALQGSVKLEPLPATPADRQTDSVQDPSLISPQNSTQTNIKPKTHRENNHQVDKSTQKISTFLPEMSRGKYLKAYDNFIIWKKRKNQKLLSENVLLAYFSELSKSLQPSTLWATYSMLKTTIDTKCNVNIKRYTKLTMFLKSLSAGYIPKKSRVLTEENVKKFLKEAPDEVYLADKVILIFGINGACRSIELTNMKTSDLEDHRDTLLVKVPHSRPHGDRAFRIRDFVDTVRKYQTLRPNNINHDRFFLNYAKGKCTRQPIGRHKLAAVPRNIAAYLKLPNAERYTGHCFRRTSATLLADAGRNVIGLKRSGWKFSKVMENYTEGGGGGLVESRMNPEKLPNSTITETTASGLSETVNQAETENSVSQTSDAAHRAMQVSVKLEPLQETLLDTQPVHSSPKSAQETNLTIKTQNENLKNNELIHQENQSSQKINAFLPEISREKYLKVYDNFVSWKTEKKEKSLSENVFLSYFSELSKSLQPSTLWATYSMLKATIETKCNVNIKRYTKLTAFLKNFAAGHKPKKSRVLTEENVEAFLATAPDEVYLADKVTLIFGINGACTALELTNIKTSELEDRGGALLVSVPQTKTKSARTFQIRDEYLNTVRKYITLRPENVDHDRFFIQYFKGKCGKQPIGRHKLAAVPKTIAGYLQLPNAGSYTGHCFRRTSATLLAEAGGNLKAIKRVGGWKSSHVVQGYIQSVRKKRKVHVQTTLA